MNTQIVKIGQIVGCNRCERTFTAEELSGSLQVRDLLMVAAALVIGAILIWLLVRGGT